MKWLVTGTLAVGLAIGLIGAVAAQQDAHHSTDQAPATTATTIETVDQAKQQATDYLAQIGLSNLSVGEVVPFAESFYVAITDPTTGNGTFELLVTRDGGFVYPEPGPTMMWNTEYSPMFGAKGDLLHDAMESDMMGGNMTDDMTDGLGMGSWMMGRMLTGMMGHGNGMMDQGMKDDGSMAQGDCPVAAGYQAGAAQPLTEPLTTEAAVAKAKTFLTEQLPNATATSLIAFPGYVTVKIEQGGQVVGLLSVQTSTGAVWQHVWHGSVTS